MSDHKQIPDTGAGETLTFAHITDPHLTSPERASLRDLLNKRVLSYISWRRHRRMIHDRGVLDMLIEDLRSSEAQHLAITGDLTQLGLDCEFQEALQWLRELSAPGKISLIPGNHDCLIAENWDRTLCQWQDFMASDDSSLDDRDGFPTIRVRGPVMFIGLSSAVPTSPFMATGTLGRRQRLRLGEMLEMARQRKLFRVVLIHHPLLPGGYKWRKRLVDSQAVSKVIRRFGAELVLHGHTHKLTGRSLDGPDGKPIPIIGLSSASAGEVSAERAARYSLWTVTRIGDTFQLQHRSRVYDASSHQIREGKDWNPLRSQ
jgi:3',5'-cyclic AMP phosphodiesterase CpdA